MKILQLFFFVLLCFQIEASHLKGVEARELMLNDHEDKANEKTTFSESIIEEGITRECNREILITYGMHGLEQS